MPWGDVEWRDPWLPVGEGVATVAEQEDDPSSVLNFCREVIALRRSRDDLVSGAYIPIAAEPGVWAWHRGGSTGVALNLTGSPVSLSLDGDVVLSTRGRDDSSRLEPGEGVVVALT
jgi:alpha-glucosidase